MHRDRAELPRRTVLLGGATVLIALPVAACGHQDDESEPDPLIALESSARADAATARAIASRYPQAPQYLGDVGKAREAQANALRKEIDRLAGEQATPSTSAAPPAPKLPGGQRAAVRQLSDSLSRAQHDAGALVPSLPGYRAGLVGSVASGCAGFVEVLAL